MEIWKYGIEIGKFDLAVPMGAQILHVNVIGGIAYFWAKVDPSCENETRVFEVFCTGQPIPNAQGYSYVGTFVLFGGGFVGHLFEVVK